MLRVKPKCVMKPRMPAYRTGVANPGINHSDRLTIAPQ